MIYIEKSIHKQYVIILIKLKRLILNIRITNEFCHTTQKPHLTKAALIQAWGLIDLYKCI